MTILIMHSKYTYVGRSSIIHMWAIRVPRTAAAAFSTRPPSINDNNMRVRKRRWNRTNTGERVCRQIESRRRWRTTAVGGGVQRRSAAAPGDVFNKSDAFSRNFRGTMYKRSADGPAGEQDGADSDGHTDGAPTFERRKKGGGTSGKTVRPSCTI